MRTDSLIALKIGQGTPASPAGLRPMLDRATVVIEEALQAFDQETDRTELTGHLHSFRTALAGPADPAQVGLLTHSCFDMCEQALHTLQAQQQERGTELPRLVALVRDTRHHAGGRAATPFPPTSRRPPLASTALLGINDVQQLKQRLTAEVGDLQRLAIERRAAMAADGRNVRGPHRHASRSSWWRCKHEAALDPLTGIANRRHFEQTLREALQSAQREVVVAMLDIDDFKTVNDTGGHAAGDAVLQAVAQTLKASVRKHDLVARLGGDEFALHRHQRHAARCRAAHPLDRGDAGQRFRPASSTRHGCR